MLLALARSLSTSADAPALSAVYKMVELKIGETVHYTAKFSGEKSTLPAAKQVYRYPHCDMVALYNECNSAFKGEPLLRPVILNGELVEPLPSAKDAQSYARSATAALPAELRSLDESAPYDITISQPLLELAESVRSERQLASIL